MSTEQWLRQAFTTLTAAGITTARLDSIVLLEDCLRTNRAQLLAHPELILSTSQRKVLDTWITRRQTHEPLAYIRGKTEFYGREFKVSAAVLEPRPESETMIDLLITAREAYLDAPAWSIADIGTGSGVLGITAKLELPNSTVELLDIDADALEIAKMNVIKYTTIISVIKNDLLADSDNTYDVLLCNLPYVPDDYPINIAAQAEPKIAIFGGTDGLNLYRRLFEQIRILQNKPLLILTESLPTQHAQLSTIAAQAAYKQTQEDDFIQVFTPLGRKGSA
jgi:release factor glutamine methyltransferase